MAMVEIHHTHLLMSYLSRLMEVIILLTTTKNLAQKISLGHGILEMKCIRRLFQAVPDYLVEIL